jgi:signal transduction histidine kinase/DNA-binding response OmpR family regulator
MALRLNSLKTRMALTTTVVIVVILVANAVYLILNKRAELRRDIEDRATVFALLTRKPICEGYDLYYPAGFFKFRTLMKDYLNLEPDVERIQIVSVSGEVLFDSSELEDMSPRRETRPLRRQIEEKDRLDAVKKLEHTLLPAVDSTGAPALEVVAPYMEDWGQRRLTVLYLIHYRNLLPSIGHLMFATGGLMLLSILVSVVAAVALASRITRPLEELTAGAQSIAVGQFDRRLAIRSNDELQILAETFNYMTERLKENIEELEESNKKLAAVNEELKELDRMKSDLLANVSHELRTPLTAIKGYTDYILDRKLGPISEKQEKGLVVVQRNLDRLSKSINALLDFSRMDVGKITLSIHPFSLAQLVSQIGMTLRSELEKKRLQFEADIEPELPQLIGDREKISQVLENLVINAMKFTPEGGRITVAAARAPNGGRSSAEVRVSDTGIGIPRDQIGKIFNRFHQVDGSTTRRFGGVGLGLAIVKSILDAHGTQIVVESEEGRGTLFRFTLPILDKPEIHVPAERPHRLEHSPILVVDDEPEVLRVLRGYLQEEGFEVITAATAAEGAREAVARHPSVILLDLLLPDRSGLDLLQSLKADPATLDIPVLIVSVANDSLKALSLGASECLLKPVDRGRIVGTVRRLLAGSREGTPRILVVDDEPDTLDFIRQTLASEGYETTAAHNGREALDAMARDRPDLVLLDIMMPELSGFEVLEAMARDASTSNIPVVVLTARGDDVDARNGLALGARRYLSKPFDVRALVAEIRRHVGRGGRGDAERRATL